MQYKKVVIKVGTNVISQENGLLDLEIIENLVEQIAFLKKNNTDVILVSSGAVGAGRSMTKLNDNLNTVVKRQILASIGQPKLLNIYSEIFEKYNYICAQILATKEDFRDRLHYLNMKNCFNALLQDNIIPIVNENDVVSVTELMFTDNDELAGLIASMMNVDALIILTNVDGVYKGNPKDKDSVLIEEIDFNNIELKSEYKQFISPEKSQFGRGGMLTKYGIGEKMSSIGISTHIINGKSKNNLKDLVSGKKTGTKFIPSKDVSNIKKWIAYSEGYEKAVVYINEGAENALKSKQKAVSLLPVGIISIQGNFEKGDIIKISNEKGDYLGLGLAQYNSVKINSVIGKKGQKPLIHYNYIYLKN